MSATRRQFLTSLAVAAVAPSALGRAATAANPTGLHLGFDIGTAPSEHVIAVWRETYSHQGNPAWIFYDLCRQRYGEAALDRSSFAQLAAYCDEPVTTS